MTTLQKLLSAGLLAVMLPAASYGETEMEKAAAEAAKLAAGLDLKTLSNANFTTWTPSDYQVKWRNSVGKVVKLKFSNRSSSVWQPTGKAVEEGIALAGFGASVDVLYPPEANQFLTRLPHAPSTPTFFVYVLILKNGVAYTLGKELHRGLRDLKWEW